MLNVNGSHFRLLEQSLNAASLRQSVIANNIANVDTPRFKRSEVQFEDLLQRSMTSNSTGIIGRRTDSRHLYIGRGGSELKPQITIDENSVMNNNLNNVDIETEMSMMAKNQLRYNAMIQQVSHEIKYAKTALEVR